MTLNLLRILAAGLLGNNCSASRVDSTVSVTPEEPQHVALSVGPRPVQNVVLGCEFHNVIGMEGRFRQLSQLYYMEHWDRIGGTLGQWEATKGVSMAHSFAFPIL